MYLHPCSNSNLQYDRLISFDTALETIIENVITDEACSFVVFPEKIQTAQHILFANNVHTDVTEYYSKRAQKL